MPEVNDLTCEKSNSFLKRLSDHVTGYLLAAPPAFQLAVAITALLGPFLTLGPFVKSIITLWLQFSDWVRILISDFFDFSIHQIIWPNVFFSILLIPVALGALFSFFRRSSARTNTRNDIRSIALSYVSILLLMKVYFFSLNPDAYLASFTFWTTDASILHLMKFFDLIFLFMIILILAFKDTEMTRRVLIYIGIFVLLSHAGSLILNTLTLAKAFEAESQRIFAFKLYQEGKLTKEAVDEYFALSFRVEYLRYSQAAGMVAISILMICCVMVPRRLNTIAFCTLTFLGIFAVSAMLEAFLQIGKTPG